MVDIAVLFGAERSRAVRDLKHAIEFEMQLANVRYTITCHIASNQI